MPHCGIVCQPEIEEKEIAFENKNRLSFGVIFASLLKVGGSLALPPFAEHPASRAGPGIGPPWAGSFLQKTDTRTRYTLLFIQRNVIRGPRLIVRLFNQISGWLCLPLIA